MTDLLALTLTAMFTSLFWMVVAFVVMLKLTGEIAVLKGAGNGGNGV